MTIKLRLILLAVASLLSALLVGAVGMFSQRGMVAALDQNTIAASAMRHHMESDQLHDALRADVLAAALAGSRKQESERKQIDAELATHLKDFRRSLKENEDLPLPPLLKAEIAKLRPQVDAYLAASEATAAAAFATPENIDAQLEQFMQRFSTLEKQMAELSDKIEQHAQATQQSASENGARAAQWQVLVLLLAAVIIIAMATLTIVSIVRNIARLNRAVEHLNSTEGDLNYRLPPMPGEFGQLGESVNRFVAKIGAIIFSVRDNAATIATAAREISQGNLHLSERTESQAGSVEETATSMEELIRTVQQNAANSRQANTLAANASEVAQRGGKVVEQVVSTMGRINESSRRIADIIGAIDAIAFQTNILALNAAVEAARAGEQGRGFAVVAAEVRNLAQRSAGAAKEIKDLITASVASVDEGARLVDTAGATMNEVVASVRQVTDVIGEISAASGEQAAGIEQINSAILHLDQVTQQNAALVEEASAAAQSLHDNAAQLEQVVSVFGRSDPAPSAYAAPQRRPQGKHQLGWSGVRSSAT